MILIACRGLRAPAIRAIQIQAIWGPRCLGCNPFLYTVSCTPPRQPKLTLAAVICPTSTFPYGGAPCTAAQAARHHRGLDSSQCCATHDEHLALVAAHMTTMPQCHHSLHHCVATKSNHGRAKRAPPKAAQLHQLSDPARCSGQVHGRGCDSFAVSIVHTARVTL